jgi:dihydropyrimidinase
MTFDLIITNGTVVTASDTYVADIAVRGGKIVAIGTDLGSATRVIDATGKLVMPGGIDSHVHLEQPGAPGIIMGDTFETGTRSAVWGGNTTVMPFCLQQRGESLRAALTDYHARAEGNCYTDVSFHLIVSDPTPQVVGQELPALLSDGYSSLKVFMTYEDLALSDYDILNVMSVAREHGALVMVHAEGLDAIRFHNEKLAREGKTAAIYHGASRPIAVEREATHRAISLAEMVDVPVMIVHVSNAEAIEEIARAKRRGIKVFSETCPQYLVLTEADMGAAGTEGNKYVCSPPPRDAANQQACWDGLSQNIFEVFSSDHCPYRYDETGKLTPDSAKGYVWIPNGIPGIETRLPILFSEGVKKGRITPSQFVALSATNAAKIYGLYPQKGALIVGADADIAIWDPDLTRTITHADLHDGVDYTPYEGIEITGWPVTTIVRGKVMVEDRQMVGDKGWGAYQARSSLGSEFRG